MAFTTTFRHSSTPQVRGRELDANLDALGVYVDGTFLPLAGGAISWTGTLTGTWDGWIGSGETWTYASATTFTISGDLTGKYQKGDKLKLTQTSAKYFYVTAVSYSNPNTTVTVTGGSDYALANAAITGPYYSKAETPQDHPVWFNWTPGYTGFSANPSGGQAKFSIHRNVVSIIYGTSSHGTSNSSGFTITGLPVSVAVAIERTSCHTVDNGANQNGAFEVAASGTSITLRSSIGGGSFTGSGLKSAPSLQFRYQF